MTNSSSIPPLASLRAFEAIARFGSVKLASESLNLTPSAISHQIRTLETHFGVQLVQRSGRNIVLTESGSLYASAVLSAFNELFRASDLLDLKRRDHVVRVSVTPTFATLAALPHLEKLRASNAGLDLRLEARNTPVDLERDQMDAAVQLSTPPFPGLMFHRVFKSRLMPCASPRLLERLPQIRSVQDMANVPLIEFSTAPDGWKFWFRANGLPEPAESKLLGDSLLTGLQMARSEMGAVLAPFPLVSSMVATGVLAIIPVATALPMGERDFYFTYRKVDAGSEKIKAVLKWLKAVARKLEMEAAEIGV
jgi:LysR family glycine cleavage system transcriptional activator